ncbi:MAG: hypothetical protein HYU51_19235 [Candidatus Rokubacteria bacterium]|nr:hypothetical protein [Candidatus Rokubacteria bacterium]
MVVAVDKDEGRVLVKDHADACTELSCHERTIVVSDEEMGGNLEALNPGDIIKVESAAGRAEKIVVLRRVWEELASPEL